MQREAQKKKEYSERAKVDVRDIMQGNKEVRSIRAGAENKGDQKSYEERKGAPADPDLLESKDQISDTEEEIQMLID